MFVLSTETFHLIFRVKYSDGEEEIVSKELNATKIKVKGF